MENKIEQMKERLTSLRRRKCYKCGKEKLAIANIHEPGKVEMVVIPTGEHKGEWICLECNKDEQVTLIKSHMFEDLSVLKQVEVKNEDKDK